MLITPALSNGRYRSSRRLTSNSSLSFCALLVLLAARQEPVLIVTPPHDDCP
jgi:hypothetical protein